MDEQLEKRFQEATIDARYNRHAELIDIGARRTWRLREKAESGRKRRNRVLGATAVVATATATFLGGGHTTLGEGFRGVFPDDNPPVTNPKQLEKQTEANGGQLPVNRG